MQDACLQLNQVCRSYSFPYLSAHSVGLIFRGFYVFRATSQQKKHRVEKSTLAQEESQKRNRSAEQGRDTYKECREQ
jgi:hypothetical protein